MAKKVIGRTVTAIDIGTTKIVVIIATTNADGRTEVVGIGQHPSYGLR